MSEETPVCLSVCGRMASVCPQCSAWHRGSVTRVAVACISKAGERMKELGTSLCPVSGARQVLTADLRLMGSRDPGDMLVLSCDEGGSIEDICLGV